VRQVDVMHTQWEEEEGKDTTIELCVKNHLPHSPAALLQELLHSRIWIEPRTPLVKTSFS